MTLSRGGRTQGALALQLDEPDDESPPMLRLVVDDPFDADFVDDAINDPDRLSALATSGLLFSEAEPFFDRLTMLAASLLQAPVAVISLVHPGGQFLKSQYGLEGPICEARGTDLETSVCKHVVAGREAIIADDLRLHPRLASHPAVEMGFIAYAGIPLETSDGQVLGALCVADTKPRKWPPRILHALEQIAQSTMTEIELRMTLRTVRESREILMRTNAKLVSLHRVADEEARRDELTSLLNRRGFIASAMEAAKDSEQSVMIFADLDGLKRINDELGHEAGDAAIATAAQAMKKTFRANDIIGRLGGDELAAFLPHANEATAKRLVARIEEEVVRFNVSGEQDWTLAISVGYVARRGSFDLETMLGEADAKMYEAKRARRAAR